MSEEDTKQVDAKAGAEPTEIAPQPINANDINVAPVPQPESAKPAEPKGVEPEKLGDKISSQQVAEATQGLKNQYRNDAEGVKPMSQPKEAANEQSAAIEAQIEATKQQVAQLAKSRQAIIGEMKPESNPATSVAASTVAFLGLTFAADKLGNAKGAAENFVKETAKSVIKDGKFDVAKKVTDTFKGNTELAETIKNTVTEEIAPLINKEGIVEILQKTGDKVSAKAGEIAKQIIKGDDKGIEKAVENAFKEKGKGFFAKSSIPAGSEQALTDAKNAIGNIAGFRKELIGGEHVGELEGAFKEKMNGFAVGVVDKFNTTLPNVDPKIKLTALLVGTGLAVLAGHHVLTSGERAKTEEQKKEIGQHTAAILKGQEELGQLSAMRG